MVEKERKRLERIAWGESSDVLRLPEPRPDGSSVVRIERRFDGSPTLISPADAYYTFYAMKLAHMLFPKNVIEMTGVEPYRVVHGDLEPMPPRYFSKYYPLPEGSRKEIEQMRKEIKEAHKRGDADDINSDEFKAVEKGVKEFDKKMRRQYPDLISTYIKLLKAGFKVPHPEINFTVHKGNIMFYEVGFLGKLSDTGQKSLGLIAEEMSRQVKEMPRQQGRRLFIDTVRAICELSLQTFNKTKLAGKQFDVLDKTILWASRYGLISISEMRQLEGTLGKLAFDSKDEKTAQRLVSQMKLEGEKK